MMKSIFFVLAFLFSVSVFAQGLREGLKAKNAGNEAYKKKEYVSAINNWEKYFRSGEKGIVSDSNTLNLYIKSLFYSAEGFLKKQDYQSAFNSYEKYILKAGKEAVIDGKTTFNLAFSAFKIRRYDVADTNFHKSIDFGYKPDLCKLYLANIYQSTVNEGKMKAILIESIEQYPNSKYLGKMASMLKIPLLKDASIPFNSANELAKSASDGSSDEYLDKMNLACEKFQESIPLFEKVLKYNPQNEQSINFLQICRDNIQSFNHYKDSLANEKIEK